MRNDRILGNKYTLIKMFGNIYENYIKENLHEVQNQLRGLSLPVLLFKTNEDAQNSSDFSFFKTNEVTDFTSFISRLPLTLTATLNCYFYWHLA